MEKSFKSIATNYGLYLALWGILILLIMYAFDIEKSWILSITSMLGTIAITVLGIKDLKKSQGSFLKLGEAIKMGMAIAAVSGLIIAVFSIIHYTYIYPEFIENIREESLKQAYERNPDMTNEQLESASGMMDFFTSPVFMGTMSLIGSLFIGLIISLISGLIMKNEDV